MHLLETYLFMGVIDKIRSMYMTYFWLYLYNSIYNLPKIIKYYAR